MLAQFQSLYPNGSLISELVQIFQGKYIVRASVQIEGITRATGMAAAETVEAAEDQARNRALTVLGITDTPQASIAPSPKLISQVQANPISHESTYTSIQNEDFGKNSWSVTNNNDQSKDALNNTSVKTATSNGSKTEKPLPDFNQKLPDINYYEPELEPPIEDLSPLTAQQPEIPTITEVVNSNVTPFTPRSYSPQENVTSISGGTGKKKKKAEPVDLSDVIAKTDVELQRLGWTPEQGREYLIKTYGKRGRTLLTEDELHSFLKHLESQPDPIAGF
ncbi:hypothetical protein ACN23B_06195 [Anabaena sp. FACHB-709]|uniref:Uncharacterized protein n=2 Tax=Nostocaceae TaxID=1162 RepID=A0A1Z4KTC5_ANAVA|nr:MULTISPECIES: hypothetical protein [Nostocaceae]BAY72214.1 hypothetical protein NIES23_50380 [Trichormus variabilis NIES-23]HBW29141.1 hypothetical protein [Nostoc sp. UBA8866]MBD2170608.1 hypothetical protein [Anabaena cylindrica FACHB-318]MBD2262395.1 hypothetical protein [Anabaena sp. FACHB-709]MBD2271942.1 hypothetical protein [Nostoc sp. PCC 7120 = FACHB-418]